MSLLGKVSIVTGSTSGIGLGIAKSLGKQGSSLVVHGSRDEDEAKAALDELRGISPKVVYCKADLSKGGEAAAMLVNSAMENFGRVDILVNNAGIQYVSPIEDFPPEKWDLVLSVNLSSAFHLIRLVVPLLKKNEGKWGRIVNISSVHGVVASIHKAAYCAAKHGLNGLTKVVGLELAADTHITCNAVCPGWVHTPLVQKQIDVLSEKLGVSNEDATKHLLAAKEPSQKFTTTEHIGDMVVFLCSEAASNITGSELKMDGGWTAC
eukprot:TRINITY_DN569_c0_g1_i1.p1 TRINITY_DN569_c0_g1~~TRINITY_DN569_c0_g1_i1.p1  ORF type:complete len:300 (-),score=55.17 TRINITY_DN569_c0_g1_i1:57-851(-)